MNGRFISIVLGILLVGGIGAWIYQSKPDYSANVTPSGGVQGGTSAPSESINPNAGGSTSTTTKPPTTTTTKPPAPSGITMTQVAQHSTRSSCWAAINGSVYDLTSWIPNHPGGEAPILSLCGKDGTSAFNTQHGGQQQPAMVLAGFKLGVLAK